MSTRVGSFDWHATAWVSHVQVLAMVGVAAIVLHGFTVPSSTRPQGPWEASMGFATVAMSLPFLFWMALLVKRPRSRVFEVLDPLMIACLPLTGLLWLVTVVRLVDASALPGL